MKKGKIKTKRWCDKRESCDGFRVLTCRWRPRGLTKEEETWDAWWRHLGPSADLLYDIKADRITWPEYVERYKREMATGEGLLAIRQLARAVAQGKTITLLCSASCTNAKRCHRSLLAKLINAVVPPLKTR